MAETKSDVESLKAVAEQCVIWDPNPETRAETEEAITSEDAELLRIMFGKRIAFGTAGLRGRMGAGTSRMNDLIVLQAAQGLCAYLIAKFGEDAMERGVAIGYDHRRKGAISSKRFAAISTAAFLSKGFKVYLCGDVVATPLVPFMIDQYKCVGGVMITASHNPKDDNGYKVYYANGSQIIKPHDKGIAASILDNLEPWLDYSKVTFDNQYSNERCIDPSKTVFGEYHERVAKYCSFKEANASTAPVVYSAMHGVGSAFVRSQFESFGLPPPVETKEQAEPDPDFPTVAFPNPEEGKSALDLAFATAKRAGSKLVLANDPDADRLAVAEQVDGEWRVFTGDQIGALLADWLWTRFHEQNPDADLSKVYMLASTVSSKMIGSMAEVHGFKFEETLTGFKWLGNRSAELRSKGNTVLFSYEEAIGFCIGDTVKDKDGVAAAAVFAEMAGRYYAEGKTVAGRLAYLYDTYGHFITKNHYVIIENPESVTPTFNRLRNNGQYWLVMGRYKITDVRDLTTGVDTSAPDGLPTLPVSASSEMITFKLRSPEGMTFTATLRTSGTEPKLKYYVEIKGTDPEATRSELDRLVSTLIEVMLEPAKNGFRVPKAE